MNKEQFQTILRDRTVGIMLFGNSIYELEGRIEEFKDFDICWASVGQWEVMEKYVLSKINKQLEITFDTAEVERPIRFEIERRIPRLEEFLSRPINNCHITMRHATISKLRQKIGCNLEKKYADKIIYAEDICPAFAFCVSFPLFITSLWALGVKKIILFGCDGSKSSNSIDTYFHPEEVIIEKKVANNASFNLTGDCGWVASGFPKIISSFRKTSGIDYPEIINCSLNSVHNLWEKLSYDELLKMLKKEEL